MFYKGRLKFGGSKDSAPFPSAIVVFSSELTDNQEDLLKRIGTLVVVR